MASDFFLEIVTKKGGKIKGEGPSQACPEQISVKSFAIGIESPTDYDSGQATGRVHLEHAEFEFATSIATTSLVKTLCTNDVITSATLSCRKLGAHGKEAIYLQWRFNSARLVSFKMTGEDDITADSIRIAYAGLEVSYRQQKADGSLSPTPLLAAYDSDENRLVDATLK
jgi:type VI secretion system secreted protein Hcp